MKQKRTLSHRSLAIGWLYPELMSTYGDRGNIIVLKRRCEWRGIAITVVPIDQKSTAEMLSTCDLVFGGGAQDRQQSIVIESLRGVQGDQLKENFDRGTPGLFVCGAPQLLGHWYSMGDGTKLMGLGIFDMVTKHFGKEKPRCIGNLVAELHPKNPMTTKITKKTIVGFENHGGRTYLGSGVTPFASVTKGFGNNGEDGTEGAVYNNCIATYSHGPFLSKNPHIADWLIEKALEAKYKKAIKLSVLDDSLEWQAHETMVQRILASA